MKINIDLKQSILSIVFLMGTLLVFSCNESKENGEKINNNIENNRVTTAIKNVNAIEFKKIIDKGNVVILDVRTPEEVAQGNIKGSSHINFYDEDFVNKINLINKEKTICVYCTSGGRSTDAAKILQKNGFTKIYQLNGGTMAWENSKLPLTKSTSAKDEHIQSMSLEDFNQLLKTNLPVLVDFHTVWCAPCRKMAPVIDEIEKEYENKAIVIRIDADKSKDIAQHYDIKGVPVFMLFKNGEIKWQHKGLITKEELTNQLDK
ncbi:MAG: thioredoxin [Flavobacteriales bacterium]|nr:MAG: thioredoxin [Flavobacteriales bacterium]